MPKILKAEATPNPNAVKLVFDQKLITGGNRHFAKKEDAWESPLAQSLLEVPGVESIFLMEEFLTINKTTTGIWDFIFFKTQEIVTALPEIKVIEVQKKEEESAVVVSNDEFDKLLPEEKLALIDRVIEQKIRPGLARDGGGLQILGLDGDVLRVKYQGACGSCPSSTAQTLHYISNMLQETVSPKLTVEPFSGVSLSGLTITPSPHGG